MGKGLLGGWAPRTIRDTWFSQPWWVGKSPGCGTPSKWPFFMASKWGMIRSPLTIPGMILQVGRKNLSTFCLS